MGKQAGKDEINFNYPIPREVHKRIRMLSLEMGVPVKDLLVCALKYYADEMEKRQEDDL